MLCGTNARLWRETVSNGTHRGMGSIPLDPVETIYKRISVRRLSFILLTICCIGCNHPVRADYTLFAPYENRVACAVDSVGLPACYRYLPLLLTDCDTAFVGQYASGMWALSVPVAHRYGLLVNDSVDERHDPIASTVAATSYLCDLRRHFTCNDTAVLKQYALCMPMLRVSPDSLLWALEMVRAEYDEGKRFSSFLEPMNIVREEAARRDSLMQEERRRRAAEIAEQRAKAVPAYIIYKVKSGDYLGRIAQRHHVTVSQLKKWNNLKSDVIREGQKLKIYKS